MFALWNHNVTPTRKTVFSAAAAAGRASEQACSRHLLAVIHTPYVLCQAKKYDNMADLGTAWYVPA